MWGVLIIFMVTIFTVDHTRVFNMLVFPLVVALLLNLNIQKVINNRIKRFNKIMVILFFISIFVPNYYIWEGKIYASSYPSIIKRY